MKWQVPNQMRAHSANILEGYKTASILETCRNKLLHFYFNLILHQRN